MNNLSVPVRYGLIVGIVSIVVSLIGYLLGITVTSMIYGLLAFAITILIIYLCGVAARTESGGYISWKSALKAMWVCGMIGFLISTVYQVVFMEFIDPSVKEQQKEMQIKAIEQWRGSMGDEAADAKIEEIQSTEFFGIKNISLMMAGSIIVTFIISAILALVLKKENPNYDPTIVDNQS